MKIDLDWLKKKIGEDKGVYSGDLTHGALRSLALVAIAENLEHLTDKVDEVMIELRELNQRENEKSEEEKIG